MELFKLIIFSTSLFLFGPGTFFDTVLIYLFLNLTYKSGINYNNTYDPMMVLVNLINIMMHLIVYQFHDFVKALNKTQYGSIAVSTYNYLDDKVTRIKQIIFHWFVLLPMKFVMRKTIGSLMDESVLNTIKDMKVNKNSQLQNQGPNETSLDARARGFASAGPIIRKTEISKEIKLETNQDISNFLDRLLDENKKSN